MLRRGDFVIHGQARALGDAEELIIAPACFTRAHGVDIQRDAGAGVKVQRLGTDEGAQQGLEFTEVMRLPGSLVFKGGVVLPHHEDLTPLSGARHTAPPHARSRFHLPGPAASRAKPGCVGKADIFMPMGVSRWS